MPAAQRLADRRRDGDGREAQSLATTDEDTFARMMRAASPRSVIQPMAFFMPTRSQLARDAPPGAGLFGEPGAYEQLLFHVGDYPAVSAHPKNSAGQLRMLALISGLIAAWEAEHGLTEQPPETHAILGMSKTDRRRRVLNDLKADIARELVAVRHQARSQANADQQADREALEDHLVAGAAQHSDRRLKNACDWIIGAHKTALYAVTPVGDSEQRLQAAGKDPKDTQALFPAATLGAPGAIGKPAVTYNADDYADTTNVQFEKAITLGWNFAGPSGKPGAIAVVRPALKSQEDVWQTIVHEVQHDSDMHAGRDALAGLRHAAERTDALLEGSGVNSGEAASLGMQVEPALAVEAEDALRRYKSEFRAYSRAEATLAPGATTASTIAAWRTLSNDPASETVDGRRYSKRQIAIFNHIYAGYDYFRSAWDRNLRLANGTYLRDAVVGFWDPDPEGFNAYGSPKVDDVYKALDEVAAIKEPTRAESDLGLNAEPVAAPERDPDSPDVRRLLVAIDALPKVDADFILNDSFAMMEKIHKHLAGEAFVRVMRHLKRR